MSFLNECLERPFGVLDHWVGWWYYDLSGRRAPQVAISMGDERIDKQPFWGYSFCLEDEMPIEIPGVISSFRGIYRFLSNFYGYMPDHVKFTVVVDGMEFHTTEHGFMASKTTDLEIRRLIQAMPKSGQTKRYWHDKRDQIRKGWDEMRLAVMLDMLRQKFANPELRAMLLATGDAILIEGNNWDDTFFGVDEETGEGENWLGRLLMLVRTECAMEEYLKRVAA